MNQTKLYYIKINKYKIQFLFVIYPNGSKKIYNYFDDLSNILTVFYINKKRNIFP